MLATPDIYDLENIGIIPPNQRVYCKYSSSISQFRPLRSHNRKDSKLRLETGKHKYQEKEGEAFLRLEVLQRL